MKLQRFLFIPLAALAALASPSAIFAQTPPSAPPAPGVGAPPVFGDEAKGAKKDWKRDPEKQMARLKEALALTPEQEAKIRAIYKEEAEKIRAERQANKANPPAPEERRAKMKAAREAVDASVATVLTPEQKAKFDVIKAKMKERKKEEGPAAPAPAAPATPAAS